VEIEETYCISKDETTTVGNTTQHRTKIEQNYKKRNIIHQNIIIIIFLFFIFFIPSVSMIPRDFGIIIFLNFF